VSGVLPVAAPSLIALYALVGALFGMVYPPRDRLVSESSEAGSTGKSFGFVFTGVSAGGLVSPTLLGAIIDAASVSTAFLLLSGFCLLAVVLVVAIGVRSGQLPAKRSTTSGE